MNNILSNRIFRLWFLSLGLFFGSFAATSFAIDIDQVEKEITGAGAVGWIHGAVGGRDLYVFTYRNETDFFDYQNFSLVPTDAAIRTKLAQLGRHDKVRIKGSLTPNPSPQKHIEVTSVELVRKFNPKDKAQDYQHNAKIPDELTNVDEATFLVHAIAGDGQVLVVEYKDAILPVYVKDGSLTKHLYRNDLVKLKIKLATMPDRPTHLRLNEKATNPVTVLESIKSIHGKPAEIEGALIMFPKSPEIIFNVFAVEQILPSGNKRQYTLINFDDPDIFASKASERAALSLWLLVQFGVTPLFSSI